MGFVYQLGGETPNGYANAAQAIVNDWQINGVFARVQRQPVHDYRQRHARQHAEQPADRGSHRLLQHHRQDRHGRRVVRHDAVRPADRRPVRQHRTEPVLRAWRLEPRPRCSAVVPGRWTEAARGPDRRPATSSTSRSSPTRKASSRRAPSDRSRDRGRHGSDQRGLHGAVGRARAQVHLLASRISDCGYRIADCGFDGNVKIRNPRSAIRHPQSAMISAALLFISALALSTAAPQAAPPPFLARA